jgi:spore coat protein H
MKKLLILFGCILCNLASGQSTAGDSLFNDSQVHVINLNFSQPSYWNDLVNNKAFDDANDTSTYIPATVIIDGNQLDSVGIQFKGNSSYYNYPSNKKPFTLSFNEYISGQKYNGLKNLNLNNLYQDPTFMREKVFLDFLNAKGLYAPRANYAKLYINGTYWGLYLMVERVNKTFAKDRFDNNGGNLFKGDNEMAACADLKYHGTLQSYYNCYELKTNETANDWTDLINLTDKVMNTSSAEFRDSMEKVLNTNSFIGAWAACNLFADFDSYSFRYQHNYYIYHNTATDKFDWITWDVSTAFGMDIPMTVSQVETLSVLYLTPQAGDKPLSQRMLADSTYKDTYLDYICSFASNDFKPSVLFPKIDSIANIIRPEVYADNLKMYSNPDFEDNIDSTTNINGYDVAGLKSFITNRSASVLGELNTLGYTNCPGIFAGINDTKQNAISLITYPNPTNTTTTIEYFLHEPGDVKFYVFDGFGRLVREFSTGFQASGAHRFEINAASFGTPALYYLKMASGGKTISKTISVIK